MRRCCSSCCCVRAHVPGSRCCSPTLLVLFAPGPDQRRAQGHEHHVRGIRGAARPRCNCSSPITTAPETGATGAGVAAGLAAVLCSSVADRDAVRGRRGDAREARLAHRALFQVGPPAIGVRGVVRGGRAQGSRRRASRTPASDPRRHPLRLGARDRHVRSVHSIARIGGVARAGLRGRLFVLVRRSSPERRREAVIPLAMLLGAFVFALETGTRSLRPVWPQGANAVRAGHYMDVVAYLTVPAVAFVAEELVRRWRVAVAGVDRRSSSSRCRSTCTSSCRTRTHAHLGLALFRNTVLLIPRLPLAHEVPAHVSAVQGRRVARDRRMVAPRPTRGSAAAAARDQGQHRCRDVANLAGRRGRPDHTVSTVARSGSACTSRRERRFAFGDRECRSDTSSTGR